jgi:hypothetical protein
MSLVFAQAQNKKKKKRMIEKFCVIFVVKSDLCLSSWVSAAKLQSSAWLTFIWAKTLMITVIKYIAIKLMLGYVSSPSQHDTCHSYHPSTTEKLICHHVLIKISSPDERCGIGIQFSNTLDSLSAVRSGYRNIAKYGRCKRNVGPKWPPSVTCLCLFCSLVMSRASASHCIWMVFRNVPCVLSLSPSIIIAFVLRAFSLSFRPNLQFSLILCLSSCSHGCEIYQLHPCMPSLSFILSHRSEGVTVWHGNKMQERQQQLVLLVRLLTHTWSR